MLWSYGCAYPILSFSHTHNGGALLRLKSVGISWNQHLIAFKCSVVVFPLASLCQLIITWSSIYCTYYIPSKYCMCFANSSWNSANSSWKSANSFWVQKPENRKAQIKRPTPIVKYISIMFAFSCNFHDHPMTFYAAWWLGRSVFRLHQRTMHFREAP